MVLIFVNFLSTQNMSSIGLLMSTFWLSSIRVYDQNLGLSFNLSI